MRTFNQSTGSEIVIDTGIILEHFFKGKKSDIIGKMVFFNDYINTIYVTPLTLIEIFYLTYRKTTKTNAQTIVAKLKKFTSNEPLIDYLGMIGEIKATSAISLTDSANIALANYKNVKVLFKHEDELDRQLKSVENNSLLSHIVFIDDFKVFHQ